MFETQKKSYSFFRLARFWNKKRDRFAAALNVDTERKNEIYVQLSKSATLTDLVYWLQLLFSAGIATLGLVLNSSAVIIGAMLISPLMGPILSSGLALATGDLILGLRSLANLILSTIVAVGFAVLLVASFAVQGKHAGDSSAHFAEHARSGHRFIFRRNRFDCDVPQCQRRGDFDSGRGNRRRFDAAGLCRRLRDRSGI